MASPSTKSEGGRIRGPRRLDLIPERFRLTPGIENLTTVRQLERLARFIDLPAAERPPFVRLGASVHPKERRRAPSAIYAVDIEGVVSVIHRIGDPRPLQKWMTNARRPWNLCRNRAVVADMAPASVCLIVMLASLAVDADNPPAWLGMDLPPSLAPDGKVILRAWAGKRHCDGGGADRLFIVEGVPRWHEQRAIPDIASIRTPAGEIIAHADGCVWAGPQGAIEFTANSFADCVLMALDEDQVPDVLVYLQDRLREELKSGVSARLLVSECHATAEAVAAVIESAIEKMDLRTATHRDIQRAVRATVAHLSGQQGVCA